MQIREYTKRPVTVEAVKFEGSGGETMLILEWLMRHDYPFLDGDWSDPDSIPKGAKGIYINPATGCLVIRTLEGDMSVTYGDWIIKGTAGEFYPCKPDIFNNIYDLKEE